MREDFELRLIETELVEAQRRAVKAHAAQAPTDPDDFVRWFEVLVDRGPGQGDPLFGWLAHDATLQQMRWFLAQETAGEAGFDDLVAMTQVKLPTRAKLELARNYWDEMGRGRETGMHGPMLERMGKDMSLAEELALAPPVWESLALANLMVALAINRQYTYHSVGALGAIELTAPGRAELVNVGLARLGIEAHTRQYFALHATLDVKHSKTWNAEVLGPMVAADPRCAVAFAEGALMRLAAGEKCFERYRHELGLDLHLGAREPLRHSA